jgi:hypothetical protein
MRHCADSVEANMSKANVKRVASFACLSKHSDARGRNQIGAGTSEIRRWLIGRELFDGTR